MVDVGNGKHLRVDHGKDEFARNQTNINGIEGFWGYAKTRLVKFRGMHSQSFFWHLKECEFKFNYRDCDLYRLMLKLFRDQRLKLS
jgi:transposase